MKNCIIKKIILFLSVFYISANNSFANEFNFNVKVPDGMLDPLEMLPFIINTESALIDGDQIIVYSDIKSSPMKIAMVFTIKGNIKINEISSRMRIISHDIGFSIVRNGKEIARKTNELQTFYTIPPFNMSDMATGELEKTYFYYKDNPNKWGVAFWSVMSKNEYVRKIEVSANNGGIDIDLTPYANSFFKTSVADFENHDFQNLKSDALKKYTSNQSNKKNYSAQIFTINGNFISSEIKSKFYFSKEKYTDNGGLSNSELLPIVDNLSKDWTKAN